MSEIETAESMVELRNKLGVLPTLMEVRLSPNQVTVTCRDALGNLPEDMRLSMCREIVLSPSAREDLGVKKPTAQTSLSLAMKFMDAMRYKQAHVISAGYNFRDCLYAIVAPYGKSWISSKESYFTLHQLRTRLNPIEWRNPKVREFVGNVERAFPQEATLTEAGAVAPTEYVIKTQIVYRKALKWLVIAKSSRKLRDNFDEYELLIDTLTRLKNEIMGGMLPVE